MKICIYKKFIIITDTRVEMYGQYNLKLGSSHHRRSEETYLIFGLGFHLLQYYACASSVWSCNKALALA